MSITGVGRLQVAGILFAAVGTFAAYELQSERPVSAPFLLIWLALACPTITLWSRPAKNPQLVVLIYAVGLALVIAIVAGLKQTTHDQDLTNQAAFIIGFVAGLGFSSAGLLLVGILYALENSRRGH